MRNPAILRQAPDAESAAADGSEATTKRKQVSKRLFLNDAGDEVEKIEEATGGRYVLLSPSGNKALDYKFGANPAKDRQFAVFGFHTKIGNVVNTVLNDKDEPGSPDDAHKEAETWLAGDVWAERAAGGVGARIDKDALAAAIVAVATAAGKSPDPLAIRQKLEDDPVFVRTARQVPDIANEYATRVGKPTKTVDDLLG